MEHTPNNNMENIFASLEKIQAVAPTKNLYESILEKDFTKKNVPKQISIFSIGLLCCVISFELIIVQKKSTKSIKNNLVELMPINNNNLYNE